LNQHEQQIRSAPLSRLQPNSGLPEFGHFINWPKSETSDFGWRGGEGVPCTLYLYACIYTHAPSLSLPRKRGRGRTERVATSSRQARKAQ